MTKIVSKLTAMLAAGLLCVGIVQAQESANASGGVATGIGGTVTYSVGQVVYTTNTGSTGSVAQGVQHAFEIYPIGIKETALSITLTAFPIPTLDNLTLLISNYNNDKLSYELYDMQGKLLNSGQVAAQQTQLNLNSLSAATYFLNIVNQDNKQVQSFKVIKN